MKHLIFLMALITYSAFSQGKYLTKTGTVAIEASVPSFEEVKGKNMSVTAIMDTDKLEFAALVLIKGFRFKNALMEEHFNENYMESDRFPKAIFKGILGDIDLLTLDANPKSCKIVGVLTLHGQSKDVEVTDALIASKDNCILISGAFNVSASDFDIDIPKLVREQIAKNILVSFNFSLSKK